MAGNETGHISVYDLKSKGKEKLINIISQIEVDCEINSIGFNLKLREIYMNYKNSWIIIDSTKGTIKKSVAGHSGKVNKL